MDLTRTFLDIVRQNFNPASSKSHGGQIGEDRDKVRRLAEALLYKHNGALAMSIEECFRVFGHSPRKVVLWTRDCIAKVNVSGYVVVIHYNPEGKRSEPRDVKKVYDGLRKKYTPWAYGPDIVLNPMHIKRRYWVWDEESEDFVLTDDL